MQKKVKEFNNLVKKFHSKKISVFARIIDIESELGELGKEALKSSKYGSNDFVISEDFLMEYGDALYALLSLACEHGISAEECLEKSILKMKKRLEEKNNLASN